MNRDESPRRHSLTSGRLTCLLVLSLAALFGIQAPSASADSRFCTFGSAAGQCQEPFGLAIDQSTEVLYVADARNNRVNVFGLNGGFRFAFGWGVADGVTNALQTCGPQATPPTVSCFQGIEGPGAGQLSTPRHIAVDNNPASPGFHDVYASDNNGRVQKFSPSGAFLLQFGGSQIQAANSPIAIGPGGTVYVADNAAAKTIRRFTPAGVAAGASALPAADFIADIVVDSSGDAYVAQLGAADVIGKYEPSEPTATLLFSVDQGRNSRALALDDKDNLYAAQFDGPFRVAVEYAPGGEVLRRFGYGKIDINFNGLAADPAGRVFGSEEYSGVPTQPGNKIVQLDPPPPGPLACCLKATPGNTKATVKGGVNPEGKATTYRIDYVDAESFKTGGFDNPATQSTAEIPASSDFTLHDVETLAGCAKVQVPPQPNCLTPDTEYRYQLVATNEDGESEAEGSFTTRSPFEIEETYSTEVGTDSARLHATVNPLGIPTSGYFEYVDDASYQADLAEGEGHDGFAKATQAPDVAGGQTQLSFGEDEVGKATATQLSSLTPGTTYHYRVVASDPFVSAPGPVRTLTTFPVPAPPTNSCPNAQFRTGPSATLPSCRAYEMVSPVDKNGGDIKVLVSGEFEFPSRLDQSSADGSRFAYSSVTSFGDAVSAPLTSAYLATRTDGVGWSTHGISPPRESKSLIEDILRLDTQFKSFSPDLGSGWFFQDTDPPLDECATAGFINLYRRDNATGSYEALTTAKPKNQEARFYFAELQAISADGSHAVFRANGKLTNDASSEQNSQIYEHVRGEGCGTLRLVSVLPNGKASTALANSAGTTAALPSASSRFGTVPHAISDDGARIFWSSSNANAGGPAPLYVRIEGKETIQIASGSAQYWTATPSGSKAIYSLGEELFEFDVDKAIAKEAATTQIATGFRGLVAASDDANRLYFVSEEALGGEGEAGEPNLYLREAGVGTRLVATLYGGSATLQGGDLNNSFRLSGYSLGQVKPIQNGVRASAEGSHLAFVSAGSLTGYDNHDVGDGMPTLEVYLYDAGSGRLACVSCSPSGSRPQGLLETGLSGDQLRVSARMAVAENHFTFPRALSSDGNRLFFESFEALLPRDTNGKEDVYEWQRASGEAQCKEAGAELYVPSAGGCLSLISSGQSPVDSELADASPDGSDVFIRTQSSLLPQDPGLVDVYDARINGGLPQPPVPPAACEGEACQGPLSAPNDPTPASSAFEGAGNVTEARAKKKAKKKKHAKKRHKRAKHNRGAGR